MKPDRLLRVEQVADWTGWRVSTVRAKILKRELPYIKLGKAVRIKESTIQSMIAANEVPALRVSA